jgi:CIC family chloride channel protein
MNAGRLRTFFKPGENTRMVFIASLIGVMAGLANICFRTVLEFVHHSIFVPGYAIATQGGWKIILLPLIPISGMVLLIPLAILFPGEIYGYGFTKFLRKVNIRGGYMKFRKNILKIISCSLTIGTGNSAGVEGPIGKPDQGLHSGWMCRRRCSNVQCPDCRCFFCCGNCSARHL